MKILVINSGSSSIKFKLLDMQDESVLAAGLAERIGEETGRFECILHPGRNQHHLEQNAPIVGHQDGMNMAVKALTDQRYGVISSPGEIDRIGHRVVHGGENFRLPAVINGEVIEAIKATGPLAPLHSGPNLTGIMAALELFPDALQAAVFDTAFHQTIPAHAYTYALPYEFYRQYKIRRYGFHGTSHKFVAGECARLLGRPLEACNLITLHLGNGCSMTAIKNGQSVDTSLGLTPLEGLMMGTRSGDLDPAILPFLADHTGMTTKDMDQMLNQESGLKGICGLNDLRDIHAAIAEGNQLAALALEMQTYRNKKYIGSYMAALGRVDAMVFTAGVGENDPVTREKSLSGLEEWGIKLDKTLNNQSSSSPFRISSSDSKVEIWVIPTNEELAIARETAAIKLAAPVMQ
ncbi:MAG: acetate kinase [Deltaproteobacteria bacterium]|nr:MAG: acetate kinase [Deltaproteobacteria bacterium]